MIDIEKMRADMKLGTRKFVICTVIAAAALVGAGASIGNYVGNARNNRRR